jgi:hypothetical protein
LRHSPQWILKRRAVTIAAFLVSLAFVPGASGAFVTQQYFNGTLGAHGNPSSGTNYWKTNKVWRPQGYLFAAWFANSSTVQAGLRSNRTENPIIIRGSYGYDWGSCLNQESFAVGPVTCQIYNWNA